jgi:hypothetical protein
MLQDPTERRILLQKALENRKEIFDGIEDTPIAISGNLVAFAYDDPKKRDPVEKPDQKQKPSESIVGFPTRGVFAKHRWAIAIHVKLVM